MDELQYSRTKLQEMMEKIDSYRSGSILGKVKILFEEIEELHAQGVTYKSIFDELNNEKMILKNVPYKTFLYDINYIKRVRGLSKNKIKKHEKSVKNINDISQNTPVVLEKNTSNFELEDDNKLPSRDVIEIDNIEFNVDEIKEKYGLKIDENGYIVLPSMAQEVFQKKCNINHKQINFFKENNFIYELVSMEFINRMMVSNSGFSVSDFLQFNVLAWYRNAFKTEEKKELKESYERKYKSILNKILKYGNGSILQFKIKELEELYVKSCVVKVRFE